MRITEAAQRVQRSGFPEAYEDHAEDGRALASALTGYSPAAFSCVVRRAGRRPRGAQRRRADPARRAGARATSSGPSATQSLGGFAPGGVRDGHQEGSAHYDGSRRSTCSSGRSTADNRRQGWALAHYLVAHADRLDIDARHLRRPDLDLRTRSEHGWRDYDPGDRPGDRAVLEHRDHVHVDVSGLTGRCTPGSPEVVRTDISDVQGD